ncbi:hypothetical protein NKJ88_05775 [Mesorhizobium sp. M0016]|uniref:hypothetical protein n=1 Tax=Mesorhizobium sp. M0016 TaxID=2956843 RepID=UPI0033379FD5
MSHISVSGSWGTILANAETGAVLKAPADYSDIVKFDLDEHTKAHGKPTAGTVDILDLGYWTNTGFYIAADEYHREMTGAGWGPIIANEAVGKVLKQ